MASLHKPRAIARHRHWKQRFNPNANFIWRRSATIDGKVMKAGMPVPKVVTENRRKLLRFWGAKWIELADFEAPNVATGQVEPPAQGQAQMSPLEENPAADQLGSINKDE